MMWFLFDKTQKDKSAYFFYLFIFLPWKIILKSEPETRGRLIKGHEGGRHRSCSSCTCMHYHSLTVCRPLLFCHSPVSFLLPPTFSFHPRPTFLAVVVVVVGVAILHGAQCEKHKGRTGTDSPRCTDHSGGLHPLSNPLCCSLILHLKFVLSPPSPSMSSIAVFHTPATALPRPAPPCRWAF